MLQEIQECGFNAVPPAASGMFKKCHFEKTLKEANQCNGRGNKEHVTMG